MNAHVARRDRQHNCRGVQVMLEGLAAVASAAEGYVFPIQEASLWFGKYGMLVQQHAQLEAILKQLRSKHRDALVAQGARRGPAVEVKCINNIRRSVRSPGPRIRARLGC